MQVEIQAIGGFAKKRLSTTEFRDLSIVISVIIIYSIFLDYPISLVCYVIVDECWRRDVWSRIRTRMSYKFIIHLHTSYGIIEPSSAMEPLKKKNQIKSRFSITMNYNKVAYALIKSVELMNYK